ncbi:E3 ubiquitin-protein ligase MIB1-like [Patiria miniata]|uniref:RING-type E3 ubiquitin transferase n=1 Tax=Patiria miniata TaxID=46514 RepID=A0A914AED7_PATMI|nr:E3 ubiquitin-protein ligase MIB1-like [Patiria miniata]
MREMQAYSSVHSFNLGTISFPPCLFCDSSTGSKGIRVEVPCRLGATKCRSLGIFPGARVVRGPDWQWGDQDGGEGKIGTVKEVISAEGTHRSWVKVQWPNRSTNQYRRGHGGKLDIQCTQEDTAGEFYIEHLPKLDATNVRTYLDTGDKVRLLDMDPAKLKELQLESCGWNEEIKNYRGKVGEVIVVDKDGDVKVDFGGASYFIHPLCLVKEKKEAEEAGGSAGGSELNVGGLLAALLLKSELEKLGSLLGGSAGRSSGAVLFQAAATGDTNKVRRIINDHPDAVQFHNGKGQTALQAAAHRGHVDVVNVLIRYKAPLEHRDEDGDTALNYAVLGNKPDIVLNLLIAGSKINAANNKGLTPLHFASNEGHEACVEALLGKQDCDVNYQDSSGNTPLFLAIGKKNKQIILWLINSQRVDLRQVNKRGFNSLHHAVLSENNFAVEAILRKSPSMINVSKTDGFTALHIAALNGLTEIILILVKQVDCDKELKNIVGKTALHLAIDKTHNKCIEALVNNGANVNAPDNDGNTSLHMIMMEASVKEIMRGTPVGQLLQLVEQLENEGSSSDQRNNLVLIALYLIKNGADIYIKNKKGLNVLDVTLNPGVENLIKTLFELKRTGEAPASKKRCTVS